MDSIVSDISVSENESAVKRDCLLESTKEGELLKDVGRMVRHFLNTNSSIKDENVSRIHLPIPSHLHESPSTLHPQIYTYLSTYLPTYDDMITTSPIASLHTYINSHIRC